MSACGKCTRAAYQLSSRPGTCFSSSHRPLQRSSAPTLSTRFTQAYAASTNAAPLDPTRNIVRKVGDAPRGATSASATKSQDDSNSNLNSSPSSSSTQASSSSSVFPPKLPRDAPRGSASARRQDLLKGLARRQDSRPPEGDFAASLMAHARNADRHNQSEIVRRQQGMIGEGMSGIRRSGNTDYKSLTEHRIGRLDTLEAPVRLDAFVGRSAAVTDKGSGLAMAIRKLTIKTAQNKIRREVNKQKFHERPGLRRKRLKSERWRARFKQGFSATVEKVQRMRKQGW